MFNTLSMTGTGIAITVIGAALNALGVTFDTQSLAAAVAGLVQFLGFFFIIWGQIRRPDLVAGIVRK
tara:strand:+ start:6179 stop:6379 length:201 start_codon:yes stop_codon:yes gene_type:complete